MTQPYGFSWIDEPLVAGMARPSELEELTWLRERGVELVITLTESPIRRDWIAEAGLLAMHVPIPDMEAPTLQQIEETISAIRKAHERNMGVAVHCYAGKGRTGTMLACYLVDKGVLPDEAIDRIRAMRPGSIETAEQEDAIAEFAASRIKAG